MTIMTQPPCAHTVFECGLFFACCAQEVHEDRTVCLRKKQKEGTSVHGGKKAFASSPTAAAEATPFMLVKDAQASAAVTTIAHSGSASPAAAAAGQQLQLSLTTSPHAASNNNNNTSTSSSAPGVASPGTSVPPPSAMLKSVSTNNLTGLLPIAEAVHEGPAGPEASTSSGQYHCRCRGHIV